MTRSPLALVAAVIIAASFVATDRASAEMRVISSDATARFMPLEIQKSVVIDLPGDINDVVVADPTIVQVVVHSSRRVYMTGVTPGWTNVYFFDADGRQIGALDIAVTNDPQPAPLLEKSVEVHNVIAVYRGGFIDSWSAYNCRPICMPTEETSPKAAESKSTSTTSTK